MKKILFLTELSKATYMISPAARALTDSFECKCVHFDSIYGRPFVDSTVEDGVEWVDFSQYRSRRIRSVVALESPDLIVILNKSSFLGRAFCYAARSRNVPVLHLQPGLGLTEEKAQELVARSNKASRAEYLANLHRYMVMYLMYLSEALSLRNIGRVLYYSVRAVNPDSYFVFGSREILADKMACFGRSDRDWFARMEGYDESAVVMIGQPSLDGACRLNLQAKAEDVAGLKRKYGLENEGRTALFLTQHLGKARYYGTWDEEKQRKLTSQVVDGCSRRGFTVVLKIHPKENEEEYSYLGDRADVKIVKEGDISKLVLLSDVVIGLFSTALFHAVVFKKPLIIANWVEDATVKFDFSQYGVARKAQRPDEFDDFMQRVEDERFFDPDYPRKREAFIEDFLYRADGQAGTRFAELVTSMTGATRTK